MRDGLTRSFRATAHRDWRRWLGTRSAATMRHVVVPGSSMTEIQRLLFPIACTMLPPADAIVSWVRAWHLGPDHARELASRALAQARAALPVPKRVDWAESSQVDFFEPGTAPLERPVYHATVGVKYFDGPSGHKMHRGEIREGDAEFWDEQARLMHMPRWACNWSWTW